MKNSEPNDTIYQELADAYARLEQLYANLVARGVVVKDDGYLKRLKTKFLASFCASLQPEPDKRSIAFLMLRGLSFSEAKEVAERDRQDKA